MRRLGLMQRTIQRPRHASRRPLLEQLESRELLTVGLDVGDIEATEANTANQAVFLIFRDTATSSPLTVNFSLASSSATEGQDFQTITHSATIPANETTVAVYITAIDDPFVEGPEGVTMVLDVGMSPNPEGTIYIADDDVAGPWLFWPFAYSTSCNCSCGCTLATSSSTSAASGLFKAASTAAGIISSSLAAAAKTTVGANASFTASGPFADSIRSSARSLLQTSAQVCGSSRQLSRLLVLS